MIACIIQLGTGAVATAVLEKICYALNRQDLGEWVRVGGTSLVGMAALASVWNLINSIPR